MPFFAKVDSESIKKQLEDEGSEDNENSKDKNKMKELVSDEEIKDLIKPELFAINVPAILEIFFGLFLLLVAVIKIMIGWEIYEIGTKMNLAYGFIGEGIGFLILMVLSFIVAYGLILKKNFAPLLGTGKGVFFIFYFIYGILDYRSLAIEARNRETIFFSDINEAAIYETNMYVNVLLLIFVLLLTTLMLRILMREGFFKSFFSARNSGSTGTENKDQVIISEKKNKVAAK